MKPHLFLFFASAALANVGVHAAQPTAPTARDTSVTVSENGPAVDGFLLGDPPATLYFDFDSSALVDDGQDSDFWTDLIGQSFPATTVFPGVAPGGRATGGFANGSGNQDSSHPTVVMSSPAFELVPEMSMNFIIAGGQGSAGTVVPDLASVPATSATDGFQGIALRRVSDNTYVASTRRVGNGNPDQLRSFSQAQIDAIRLASPGEKFTLDWVDYYHGGWGFASIDEVSVTVGTAVGNVPLISPPTLVMGQAGFGSTLEGTLNDPFDYRPWNPTSPAANAVFAAGTGFHNNNLNGDAILEFALADPVTVDAATSLAFDLYGRNSNQNRDDDIDVAFLDAGGQILGQLTGLAIPGGNPAHLRVFSDDAGVAFGSTVASVRVTGHDSDGTPGATNSFTLMEVRAARVTSDYSQAFRAAGNAANLGLQEPVVTVGASGFNGTTIGTVNDAFAYNPNNPTTVLPDQVFNGADGFHNNNTDTDATLVFDLTAATPVGPAATIFLDLYGRSSIPARDNDIDVAFLDASDGVLGELTGLAIPDTAPYHLRVSSAAVNTTGTVAKIRVTGHDSDGALTMSNSFTLMEVRAALALPGTPALQVVEIDGMPLAQGQTITLPSNALLTVDPGGKFTYNPNGAFFVPDPQSPETDTFTYAMGYGTGTTSTATVTVTITSANTTVYVDDDFATLSVGDPIADADPGTSGSQPATFGTDAFATMGEATAAAAAGSTIVVNAGSYPELVGLGLGRRLDVDGSVVFDSLGVSGGSAIDLRLSASLTADSASITGEDSIVTVPEGATFNATTTGISTGGGLFLDGAATANVGAATFSGSGDITFDGTPTLVVDSGNIGIPLLGSGSVIKNTTGQLVLNAANTYDGGLVINGGRVSYGAAGTPGSGGLTVNDSGQLWITKDLATDVTIQGNGWTEAAGQLGAIRFNNGFTLTGNVTVDTAGARIVGFGAAQGNINGDLLGTGFLEINIAGNADAAGTVSLLGSGAAYTGVLFVSNGRFNMGTALSGGVAVEDGGTLGGEGVIAGTLDLFQGASLVVDTDTPTSLTVGAVILEGVSTLNLVGALGLDSPEDILSYSGGLFNNGGGTLSDAFVVAGGTLVRAPMVTDNAQTLQLSGASETMFWTGATSDVWQTGGTDENWTSADNLFFNGDAVTFNDSVDARFTGALTTVGVLQPASTTFNNDVIPYNVTGVIGGTGSLTKDGPGTVSLASQHTFTGGTTVSGGVLDLTGGGANGTIRGTVTVGPGAVLRASSGDVTGYANTPASLQTINLTGGEFTIATVVNQTLGNATINMTGGMITGIAGSNLDFFQGGSTINVLPSGIPSLLSGTFISMRQANGLTITVDDGAAADDLVVDSVVRTVGVFADNNLVKAGLGKMVLNNTNTYATRTIVQEGILSLGVSTAIPAANAIDLLDEAVLDLDFMGSAVVAELTIDGAPVADGIYGATGSGAAIIDDEHFSGTGRLLIGVTAFAAWEADFGIVGAGALGMSDTDGSVNLLEFAFGTDPTVDDAGALGFDGMTVTPGTPDIAGDSASGFTARFMRRKDFGTAGSVSYTARFGSDLVAWVNSTATPTVLADAGDYELVEVPFPPLPVGEGGVFFQVVVTEL